MPARWKWYVYLLLTVMVASCCSRPTSKTEKIQQLMQAYAEYGHFNGSVLVAHRGEVLYQGGFGWANVEWERPNQADTRHRLGSLTKQFTSMLIMQLVEEGKLELHVPITAYLPHYSRPNGDSITVHHLLTHRSGIPNYTSLPDFQDIVREPMQHEQMLDFFAGLPLEFSPGTSTSYSNSGYYVLGLIIEALRGEPYAQVLQKHILDPLALEATGYDRHGDVIPRRATGYSYDRTSRKLSHAPYLDMSVPYAAGALYASVEDLFRWDQALYTDTLLSEPYRSMLFDPEHKGYGWGVYDFPVGNTDQHVLAIGHSGGINGFTTLITRFPESRSSVILLNNAGPAPNGEITRAMTGILFDQPYDQPLQSLAYALISKIEEAGLPAGLQFFNEARQSQDYSLLEGEMNVAGYHFLETERAEEAAAIFKLNVDAFPESFNVYDSYGEALLKLGRRAEAIAHYEKSLELNPDNANGRRVLERLIGLDD